MLPDDDVTIAGTPARLFRPDIIATVLDLITEAWKSVRMRSDIDRSSDEDTIAGALYWELHEEKRKRGIDGPPRIENEVASRRSEASLLPDGFIDFQFVYHWGEQDFFGMECKRVSSTDGHLAGKYVNEGLMRFVTGKYSPGHETAAMLGFVIDGNTAGSVKLIQAAILDKGNASKITGQWNATNIFGSHAHLYTTSHLQYGQTSQIILHLFQEL